RSLDTSAPSAHHSTPHSCPTRRSSDLAIRDRLSPRDVFETMKREHDNEDQLKGYIRKFFRLWATNQWKRERFAPSFHLDDMNIEDRKSTRLNSSHVKNSYAVFCLKKKT